MTRRAPARRPRTVLEGGRRNNRRGDGNNPRGRCSVAAGGVTAEWSNWPQPANGGQRSGEESVVARPDMKPLVDPSDDRWLQRGEGHPWARKPGHDRCSFGRATYNSSSTSSAPWCNRTSIASPAPSPGSSRSAQRRPSRCVEFGGTLRTSPHLASLRCLERSRAVCQCGRGSPASTTAGAGS